MCKLAFLQGKTYFYSITILKNLSACSVYNFFSPDLKRLFSTENRNILPLYSYTKFFRRFNRFSRKNNKKKMQGYTLLYDVILH